MSSPFHPELRRIRFIPNIPYTPMTARLMRRMKLRSISPDAHVAISETAVSATASLKLFLPTSREGDVPVLLWIHGGGHVGGSPEQDDADNYAFAKELGIAVAAVRYRVGLDAPAPASLSDCYEALQALVGRAEEIGIDATRVAVGGASAGGGLAAALVLLAHDRGEIPLAFQLLVYPMLDDRTVTRADLGRRRFKVWTPRSNRFGWSTYLNAEPGHPDVDAYAAPARRADLSGLPPTWIGVGDADLFLEEDREYARRLSDSRVDCELTIVPGAFHGFDALFPRADVTRQFWSSQADALRRAGIAAPPAR